MFRDWKELRTECCHQISLWNARIVIKHKVILKGTLCFVLEPHLVMLRSYSWPYTQEPLPSVLEGSHGMPGIRGRSAKCKAKTPSAVMWLWSHLHGPLKERILSTQQLIPGFSTWILRNPVLWHHGKWLSLVFPWTHGKRRPTNQGLHLIQNWLGVFRFNPGAIFHKNSQCPNSNGQFFSPRVFSGSRSN